ncbi:hypothetical protein CU669_03325 [Paramagnetospirillum kuznetsovii]|uniref:Glycosyltransferase family 2 protein n=1 Tax=Paramagnetospirillum kuznetsovii TaxID=2053833 RepID=A0A364P1K1_9PROT|nr:hypothetical protein [Paramagnetospirillum kuznetsovii]RAU23204.1 hypothetical protein CU669_03325 [Paramagnetospirillum kuznetsovii]
MEIVVKAFSRPFYLDRCLTSIRANLDNFTGITVLDDGLLPPFRQAIAERHPDVRMVSAPWSDVKPVIIRERTRQPVDMGETGPRNDLAAALERVLVWPSSMDPLPFWHQSISAMDSRYIMLIEEDTWITTHLDVAVIEAEMTRADCLVASLYSQRAQAFESVRGRTCVGEAAALEVMNAPMPPRRQIIDTYFPVSLAIFRRDFWLRCHAGIQFWIPESPIHDQAMTVLGDMLERGERPSFARITPQVLDHGFSLSTRIPPSQYGSDVTLYDISDLLSEAWRTGRLDAMRDFPLDFSENYLSAMIAASLGGDAAGEWLRLRRNYEAAYAMAMHRKDETADKGA